MADQFSGANAGGGVGYKSPEKKLGKGFARLPSGRVVPVSELATKAMVDEALRRDAEEAKIKARKRERKPNAIPDEDTVRLPSGRRYVKPRNETEKAEMDRVELGAMRADKASGKTYIPTEPFDASGKYKPLTKAKKEPTAGRKLTEMGNVLVDTVTTAGKEIGENLPVGAIMPGTGLLPPGTQKAIGKYMAGHAAGVVAQPIQSPFTVAGGTMQALDPNSTTQEKLSGGAEAIFEVFGGAVIGKAIKHGPKAVRRLVENWKIKTGRADLDGVSDAAIAKALKQHISGPATIADKPKSLVELVEQVENAGKPPEPPKGPIQSLVEDIEVTFREPELGTGKPVTTNANYMEHFSKSIEDLSKGQETVASKGGKKELWEMTAAERRKRNPLPEQPRIPDDGDHTAVVTDDGGIYTLPGRMLHQQVIDHYRIPKERVVDGGHIRNGDYNSAGELADSPRIGKKAREADEVEHLNAVLQARSEGKPVPQKVLDDFGIKTQPEPPKQTTGLANVVQDAEAKAGTLDESPRAEGTKKGEAHAQGKKLVDDGELDPQNLAREIADGKRTFKDETEVGALIEGKRLLLNKVNAAKRALDQAVESGTPSDDLIEAYAKAQNDLSEFVTNVQTGKGKWSDVGRALQEGTDVNTGSFEDVLAEYARRKGKKTSEIDAKTQAKLKEVTERLAEAERKLAERDAKVPPMFRPNTRRAVKDIAKDIEVAKQEAKDALRKATAGASANLGSLFSDEDLYRAVIKLVKLEAEAGVAQVAELAKRLSAHLDTEVTEDDVRELFKPRGKAKTLSTGAQNIADMKRELSLMERIEKLESGTTGPISPKATRAKSQRIQELQAQLDELQKQNKTGKYGPRPPRDPAKYKESLQKQIAELEAGTYAPKSKGQRIYDAETERLRAERDIRKSALMDELRPSDTVFEKVNTALNVPRSSMASMDVSYGGRQGWMGLFNDPASWVRGFKDQIPAQFMGDKSARVIYNRTVLDNPNLAKYKKMKLQLNAPNGSLVSGEESMRGNILARTGWKRLNPWLASDRGFSTYANTQRTGMADMLLKRAEKWRGGKGLSKEDYEQLGFFINTVTGRGGTGVEAFNRAAEFLSMGLFSPRFVASRIEILTGAPVFHSMLRKGVSPAVRGLIAKEWAQTVAGAAGATFLLYQGARQMFGDDNVRFQPDPTSSDFGKIIVKDSKNPAKETRIDTMAGNLQPLILGFKFFEQRKLTGKGESKSLNEYGESFEQELGRFIRGKLNPALSITWNLVEGENIIGEKYGAKEAGKDMVFPLTPKEIIEGMREDGISREDALSFLNFIGISTNSYAPKATAKTPPKKKSKIGIR